MTQFIKPQNWGGQGGWTGDMQKSVYDPNNVEANAFDYNNFINTPTIPAAQVQSDWDEADNTKVEYIKNKPTIPAAQIQSDWNQADNTKKDFIKNKPSIPTKTSDLNNDSGFITKDANNLTNYTKTSDLPDFSTYQLKSNMVTSLNSADNDHYPTAKAVKDAITSSWWGDVSWPASSVDGHLAVFDWTTGKIIKDWWVIPTPTTVVDNLTTQSATSALSANQGYVLDGKISTINGKIPSEASTSNKLADKNYVDDSINSITAYYITKNAAWDQFATKAELTAATTFYSGWVVRVPTRNDYCIVASDETHDNAVVRYIYQNGQWEFQYIVNETALTQAQLDALNSGITSWKVSSYDSAVTTIWGYGNIVTHNTSEFATSTQWGKADTALQPWDDVSDLVNDAWYITWVDWGDIWWTLSDQVDLSNALWAKADDSAVVKLTWTQTINWTKTYTTSPVVPSKTTAAGNNATTIATEAQVYLKQDTLVSWTNIKTINNNPILGSGDLTVSWLPAGWTNWQILMMVSWVPTWVTPVNQWFIMQASGSPTAIKYIWAWTEAQYSSATKNANTHYDTY